MERTREITGEKDTKRTRDKRDTLKETETESSFSLDTCMYMHENVRDYTSHRVA